MKSANCGACSKTPNNPSYARSPFPSSPPPKDFRGGFHSHPAGAGGATALWPTPETALALRPLAAGHLAPRTAVVRSVIRQLIQLFPLCLHPLDNLLHTRRICSAGNPRSSPFGCFGSHRERATDPPNIIFHLFVRRQLAGLALGPLGGGRCFSNPLRPDLPVSFPPPRGATAPLDGLPHPQSSGRLQGSHGRHHPDLRDRDRNGFVANT